MNVDTRWNKEWYKDNPILGTGVLALNLNNYKFKIGDGKSRWRVLPYIPFGGVSETETQSSLSREGTTIGFSSLGVNNSIMVSFESVWGITPDGVAYYDSAGAAKGEGAILILQIDGTPALVKPKGVVI